MENQYTITARYLGNEGNLCIETGERVVVAGKVYDLLINPSIEAENKKTEAITFAKGLLEKMVEATKDNILFLTEIKLKGHFKE